MNFLMQLTGIFIFICGPGGFVKSAKLSNSKLVPPDGMLCGATKMGFKFSKAELIERFRALTENTREPVEVVQIYVAGSKLDSLCLYDPVSVEDRKAMNVAIAEFDDGERGINITASPPLIGLGNWIPYYARDTGLRAGEGCVTTVKADTIVYFQADVVIEVIAPISQAGGKIKLSIHCEMPRPQSVDTDLKVHRVEHLGSAIGEIPFMEAIQMKFVHPGDPSLSVTEVSLDEPVRLVLWKVRQDSNKDTLKTSIMPMNCELYSDSTRVAGVTFVQNSCQEKTPADMVTSVMSRKTDIDGLEFREVYWADFKAFRFDGSSGLLASCVVRVCAKSHLKDCQNRIGSNGLPCFEEGDSREMSDYPAITGDTTDDTRGIEAPNAELELLRLAYPRRFPAPTPLKRLRRGVADDGGIVTVKQHLTVRPAVLPPVPARLEARTGNSTTIDPVFRTQMCFQNYMVYVALGTVLWLLLLAVLTIGILACRVKRCREKRDKEDEHSLSSSNLSSLGSSCSSQLQLHR